MKPLNNVFLIVLCLTLFYHCRKSKSMEDILIDTSCGEWKLEKVKLETGSSAVLNDGNRLYLIFRNDKTYDLFYKENGKRNYARDKTDLIVINKWFIDSTNQLHLSSFNNMKMIQLNIDTLAFKLKGRKYFFVSSCPK
jgi:hypothetical protein